MLPLIPFNKTSDKTKPALFFYKASGTRNGVPFSEANFNGNKVNAALRLEVRSNGFKNPDWRNKVRRKEDATTPLVLRADDVKYVNVHSVYKYRYYHQASNTDYRASVTACPYATFGTDANGLTTPSSINTSWDCYRQARNIALTYERQYVDSVTQPFQSQVFLGEVKETLDFIRHPFGKLAALANSAKVAAYNASLKRYRQAAIRHRGGVFDRTNEARLLLADIADAWFEVRFALLPLVSDVTKAFEVVNGRKTERRSSFRGDAKQTITPFTSLWPMGDLSGYRDVTGYISCRYFINTGILFNDSTNYEGFTEYLQKSTGSLVDFIPTVYELTPGSWLVDYFVNVGDYLNSIAVSSKVTRSYSSHTAVVDYVKQASFRPAIGDPFVKIESVGPQAYTEYSRRLIERKVSTDSFPSVEFKLPSGMVELANSSLYLSRKFANVFGR